MTVETAKNLTIWMEILFTMILVWNLLILIVRIVDLMMDASTTYGEKAKPVPTQKIKTTSPPVTSKLL